MSAVALCKPPANGESKDGKVHYGLLNGGGWRPICGGPPGGRERIMWQVDFGGVAAVNCGRCLHILKLQTGPLPPLQALARVVRLLRDRTAYHIAMDWEGSVSLGQWLKRCLKEARARGDDLTALQRDVAEWNRATFPKQTVAGVAEHLKRETLELWARPEDTEEMADVFILLLELAALQGLSAAELVQAAVAKMQKNKARQWPAEPDERGVYQHHD